MSAISKNMGNIDRIGRVVIALVIVGLKFAGIIDGMVATIALIFAAVFLLTSVIGFCPLYAPVGLNTNKK